MPEYSFNGIRISSTIFALAVLLSPLANTALGSTFDPVTITNPTPATGGTFGYSVSISQNYVLVGKPYDSYSDVTNAGSAYLFDATSGDLLKTFLNPAPSCHDSFGQSVSVLGNYVLVGAPYANCGDGAAYLFNATSGVLLNTFTDPDNEGGNLFGDAVSVSGNNVLVGANAQSNPNTGSGAGAVYLFNANTGTLLQTFTEPTPADYDNFGISVSMSGNNVLVGSYFTFRGGIDTGGAAYLFNATSGSLLQSFQNPTPESNDLFGYSVDISGNNVVVGTPSDNTAASQAGAAYLFNANTGALLKTFTEPTPAANDAFGSAVSVLGNNVLVGAPYAYGGSGGAFIFRANAN